jgi:hypothetical protein
MKLRQFFTSASLALLAFVVSLSQVAPVAAAPVPQQQSGGQALEIAPPVVNLSGDPGATIKTEVKIRDVSSSNLIVNAEVNDFTASNSESGSPSIVLNKTEPNPYSMISWVNPLSPMTLKTRQLVTLPITIKIPKNAAPGGYFAAVRFTGRPAELNDTGVSLSASIASLILLKVNGAAKEDVSLEEFSVRQNSISGPIFEATPIQFTTRLKNSGNLHEQPSGYVTIKDMFGKTVTTLSVNADRRNVLPQSIRKFESTLDSSAIGNRVLFGRYTADLSVTYGDKNIAINKQISFWVIPYRIIALIILALVAAFFVLRFLIRRYNRAIVAKAQGATKKK